MSAPDPIPPTKKQEPPGCIKGCLAVLFTAMFMAVGMLIWGTGVRFIFSLLGQLYEGVPVLALRWGELLPNQDQILHVVAFGAAVGALGAAWGLAALWIRYLLQWDR